MPSRVALFVIHGIGQQRPYETLDQFTRGISSSLCRGGKTWTLKPQLEICKDPLHADKQWVRASCTLTPDNGAPVPFLHDETSSYDSLSFFEYYWAPITKDKISYVGSLLFLLNAGLTPFRYWAANINVLWKVGEKKRIWKVIAKELWRQSALFLPLIALFLFLLKFLSTPPSHLLAFFEEMSRSTVLLLMIVAIRYLFLWSAGSAFWAALHAKHTWQASPKWKLWLGASLVGNLVVLPFVLEYVLRLIAWGISWPDRLVKWVSPHVPDCTACVAPRMGLLPRLLDYCVDTLREVAALTHAPYGQGICAWIKDILFLKPAFSHWAYVLVPLWFLLAYFVRFILVSYVGDVAVYVNASEFSKNYAVRSQILDECAGALSQLLRQRVDSNDSASPYVYDRVLIAAHSLGSVIAYDTLNELLDRARAANPANPKALLPEDLCKLRGMATFGCPLNKIFYFFRDQVDPRQTVRRQFGDLLRGFRVQPALSTYPPNPLGPGGPMQANTDPDWARAQNALEKDFRWINAYALADPISGHLAFYNLQEPANQKRFHYRKPGFAHLEYWEDPNFYQYFRERLL